VHLSYLLHHQNQTSTEYFLDLLHIKSFFSNILSTFPEVKIWRWLLLLFLPFLARADDELLFSESEDPAVFHQVNVITGNLNLSFQDTIVQGAQPIPLTRTYSSGGALERSPNLQQIGLALYNIETDLILQRLRDGWMVQGGWNVLPHTNLLVELSNPLKKSKRKKYKAYLAEPGGTLITYTYSKKEGKHIVFVRPSQKMSQTSGRLSVRTNPQNNLFRLDLKGGEAYLFLPNGGYRIYQGVKFQSLKQNQKDEENLYYYRLVKEVLPSQHQLHYFYDKATNLQKIESRDPLGEKIYASIGIEYSFQAPRHLSHLRFRTSDEKEISYFFAPSYKNREYLDVLESSCSPLEKFYFAPARKSIGARVSALDWGGEKQFEVRYHIPASHKEEQKWLDNPSKKPFHLDKSFSIHKPVGPQGELITVAQFDYIPHQTDVRDAQGLLTRYHHDGEKLLRIEYFDERETIRSFQRFYWEGSFLRAKAMFDSHGQPLFAKTFKYNNGNVVEEVLWGSLTGAETAPLQIDEAGQPRGGENYKKTYTYHAETHLLQVETEEEGPTHQIPVQTQYRPRSSQAHRRGWGNSP